MPDRTVFATVGTTQFDALIRTLCSPDVLAALAAAGYTALRLQVGHGAAPPEVVDPPLAFEWYRFKPSLADDMRTAALIISHAGAGSILEGLRQRATMVVVVNDSLMHNHQEELAHEMHSRRHLVATVPSELLATLRQLPQLVSTLEPLPEGDPGAFARFLTAELGL